MACAQNKVSGGHQVWGIVKYPTLVAAVVVVRANSQQSGCQQRTRWLLLLFVISHSQCYHGNRSHHNCFGYYEDMGRKSKSLDSSVKTVYFKHFKSRSKRKSQRGNTDFAFMCQYASCSDQLFDWESLHCSYTVICCIDFARVKLVYRRKIRSFCGEKWDAFPWRRATPKKTDMTL